MCLNYKCIGLLKDGTCAHFLLLQAKLAAWQRIRHFRGVVVNIDDLDKHDGGVRGFPGSGSDVILGAHVQRIVRESFSV